MTEDRITQRTVIVVMGIIAGLAFVFSFGNVWALALRLGVPGPIAPLIAPMVDLSVTGLLAALWYLSLRGVPAQQLKGATRLMHLSGLLTLALNIAEPIAAGHYGRAAVDTVAPVLLLGWGAVGPQLLRHLHAATRPAPAPEPAEKPAPAPTPAVAPQTAPPKETASPVPEPLMDAARSIAATYLAEHGRPITAPQLRTRLGVALPLATAAHARLTV
ncbi:DUF2637 domain-containing protein [Streptomyces sp. WMMB303]|uniref:DUF2637 domain-containing protein n=1 Tax=Streptomyces sp. WMMB303 TaxID=3034154 RepID=UPI0023EABA97|nr:DUF2637 domain-containing protein [Streptomyces sp. WMMB303]MDF4251419.1 DUF2637 domain-containing protein [Streptomyces sp. WMMB303]